MKPLPIAPWLRLLYYSLLYDVCLRLTGGNPEVLSPSAQARDRGDIQAWLWAGETDDPLGFDSIALALGADREAFARAIERNPEKIRDIMFLEAYGRK